MNMKMIYLLMAVVLVTAFFEVQIGIWQKSIADFRNGNRVGVMS